MPFRTLSTALPLFRSPCPHQLHCRCSALLARTRSSHSLHVRRNAKRERPPRCIGCSLVSACASVDPHQDRLLSLRSSLPPYLTLPSTRAARSSAVHVVGMRPHGPPGGSRGGDMVRGQAQNFISTLSMLPTLSTALQGSTRRDTR